MCLAPLGPAYSCMRSAGQPRCALLAHLQGFRLPPGCGKWADVNQLAPALRAGLAEMGPTARAGALTPDKRVRQEARLAVPNGPGLEGRWRGVLADSNCETVTTCDLEDFFRVERPDGLRGRHVEFVAMAAPPAPTRSPSKNKAPYGWALRWCQNSRQQAGAALDQGRCVVAPTADFEDPVLADGLDRPGRQSILLFSRRSAQTAFGMAPPGPHFPVVAYAHCVVAGTCHPDNRLRPKRQNLLGDQALLLVAVPQLPVAPVAPGVEPEMSPRVCRGSAGGSGEVPLTAFGWPPVTWGCDDGCRVPCSSGNRHRSIPSKSLDPPRTALGLQVPVPEGPEGSLPPGVETTPPAHYCSVPRPARHAGHPDFIPEVDGRGQPRDGIPHVFSRA